MTSSRPEVRVTEVGTRDGFQAEREFPLHCCRHDGVIGILEYDTNPFHDFETGLFVSRWIESIYADHAWPRLV